MGRLATLLDFEGGPLYGRYERFPFFAQRAATIHARHPAGKLVVAGCGWGYLVDELVKLGRDAWGLDASTYAILKGQALLPSIAGRLFTLDATNRTTLAAFRTAAGLTGTNRFALCVTEDLLPVCPDAEVSNLLTELRRIATAMFHIVTPMRAGDQIVADPAASARTYAGPPPAPTFRLAGLTWKTIAQWKAVVGADGVLDAETGLVS